ncbi:MAG: hypothetical protein RQ751_08455, partial [Longimicrobiales bacterium]|nr:hypothetical protein [Longimicrobiales bacterium]
PPPRASEPHPEPNMLEELERHDDEDAGPIGIFSSWKVLYWSVVIYTAALVALLWVFTVAFNHSVR